MGATFCGIHKPEIAKANILTALEHGACGGRNLGLTDDDFAEIEVVARKAQRGVWPAATPL
jgi:hypothetical protein